MVAFLSGCISVPMESIEKTKLVKNFNKPSSGHAGIYVYRENKLGRATQVKTFKIDGECIGVAANGVFFYHEVLGGGKSRYYN